MEADKQIETDLIRGLENADQNSEGAQPGGSLPRPDFISDDVLALILGYKNQFIVGLLAKRLGEAAAGMLRDLYQITDAERRVYKTALQDFIREQFPDYEDKIARISNAALASIFILEAGRYHQARTLIRADLERQAGEEKGAA